MWSIGIIAYTLFTGKLPFDHEYSEKEVARQIINDPLNLEEDLKSISKEALEFIQGKFVY